MDTWLAVLVTVMVFALSVISVRDGANARTAASEGDMPNALYLLLRSIQRGIYLLCFVLITLLT